MHSFLSFHPSAFDGVEAVAIPYGLMDGQDFFANGAPAVCFRGNPEGQSHIFPCFSDGRLLLISGLWYIKRGDFSHGGTKTRRDFLETAPTERRPPKVERGLRRWGVTGGSAKSLGSQFPLENHAVVYLRSKLHEFSDLALGNLKRPSGNPALGLGFFEVPEKPIVRGT